MARSPLIVFDLDGTLVDSRRDLAESANELLAAFDAPPLAIADVGRMVGEGARVLVGRVLAARGLAEHADAALERFLAIYERRLVVETRPYPGIVDGLERLAGLASLAVLTNKPTRHTLLMLEALGLSPYFVRARGGDGPIARKPDPAGLLALIDETGTNRRSTTMVGDSGVDLETARRAGTRSCLVTYGYGEVDLTSLVAPPDCIVSDPLDLGAVLGRLAAEARPDPNPT